MSCQSCLTVNDVDAIFCIECGAKLTPIVEQNYANKTIGISELKHPKEKLYFTFALVIGMFAWLFLIWGVILFFWVAIPVFFGFWFAGCLFEAKMLGSSVKVSEVQYENLHKIMVEHCNKLGIRPIDEFYISEDGSINAFAKKLFLKKYVILNSSLVDIMLSHNSHSEISSIIGHEIGHHYSGHLSFIKSKLIAPAYIVPFFAAAYSRSCELTADRFAAYLCGDKESAKRALATIACGSHALAPITDIHAFAKQEYDISFIFGLLTELWESHPRLTKRVNELSDFAL